MIFSIIIPCYNSAGTIVTTLDSIIDQTYHDCEIIIVDDCSTDNTVDIIAKYISQHNDFDIKLYKKEQNTGPGESRNIALDKANGDYIMFLDSDDCYMKNTLELVHDTIVTKKADIVCWGDRLETGTKIHCRYPVVYEDNKSYVALSGGSLCSFVASRRLWHEIRLPKINNAEDIAVIPILFMRASNVVVINECLYRYIYRSDSLSSKKNKNIVDNFCKSFEVTLQYPECENFPEEIEFHGIKTILYGAVLNAFQTNMSIDHIKKCIYDFEMLYPFWYNNKYIRYYSRRKRLFLKMVRNKNFLFLRLYVFMQNAYLKFVS